MASGVLYYWFQTVISYHAVKVGLNTRCMFFFRLAISCILTFTGVGYPIFKWLSYTLFRGSNSSISVAYWQPKDGGYTLHVFNCAGEWVACLCLAIYMASFYKEFQNFSITTEVCYIENDEFKGRKKVDYPKLMQSKKGDYGLHDTKWFDLGCGSLFIFESRSRRRLFRFWHINMFYVL